MRKLITILCLGAFLSIVPVADSIAQTLSDSVKIESEISDYQLGDSIALAITNDSRRIVFVGIALEKNINGTWKTDIEDAMGGRRMDILDPISGNVVYGCFLKVGSLCAVIEPGEIRNLKICPKELVYDNNQDYRLKFCIFDTLDQRVYQYSKSFQLNSNCVYQVSKIIKKKNEVYYVYATRNNSKLRILLHGRQTFEKKYKCLKPGVSFRATLEDAFLSDQKGFKRKFRIRNTSACEFVLDYYGNRILREPKENIVGTYFSKTPLICQ